MTTPEQPAQDAPNPPPAMERAEYLVDQFGVKLGQWTSAAGDRLQRLWARAREESEDIWAEAQDIRQRNAVGIGPAGRSADSDGGGDAPDSTPAESAARQRSRRSKKRTDTASA